MKLPPLEIQHFNHAAQSIRRRGSIMPLPAFETMEQIIAVFSEIVPDEHQGQPFDRVLVGCAHIVDLCIGIRITSTLRQSIEFGLALVRYWLTTTPLDFTTPVEAIDTLESALRVSDLDTMPVILETIYPYLFDRQTTKQFADIIGQASAKRLLKGFIAVSMTNVATDAAISDLTALSKRVASVAIEMGIACFQPIIENNPIVSRSHADDPVHHSADEARIAESDIVIIVADPPGSGLGAVSEMARRYRAKRVIISSSKTVSPMLIGAEPAPDTLQDGPDLDERLRSYLLEQLDTLKQENVLRASRIQKAREYADDLVAALDGLDTDALSAPSNAIVSKERFQQVTTNIALIPGMSLGEHWALQQLAHRVRELGIPLPVLRRVMQGEAQRWWPPEWTDKLIAEALRRRAEDPALQEEKDDELLRARLDWRSLEWWIELFDELDQ